MAHNNICHVNLEDDKNYIIYLCELRNHVSESMDVTTSEESNHSTYNPVELRASICMMITLKKVQEEKPYDIR